MYANQGARPIGTVGPDEVQQFFREIDESGTLPRGVDAGRAVSTVVGTMLARVSGGQARSFVDSMPPEVRELLRPALQARTEEPATFDRDEYLQRVAGELKIDRGAAESVVRSVLDAVNRHLPSKELDDVESQLPPNLKQLWRS